MKKIVGIAAVAVLLIAGLIAPAAASAEDKQCPGFNEGGKIDITNDGIYTWTNVAGDDGSSYTVKGTVSGSEHTITFQVLDGDDNVVDGATVDFCVKGGSELANTGVQTGTTWTHSQQISNVVVYGVNIPPPPPNTVVFSKAWDGDEVDLSGVTVTFDVNVDGAVGTYNDGEPIEYEDSYAFVKENVTGFPEGDCTWEQTGEAAASGTDSDGGTAASFTVTNTVTCDEDEDEPLTFTLIKDWEVTDPDGLWDEDDALVTLLIDGEPFDGTPIEVEEGQVLELGEDDVVVSEGCEAGELVEGTYVVDPEDADEDGLITLFITNEVECAEVLPTEPTDDPTDPTEEPTVEKVTVEKKVEVLAETATLPQTGVSTLLLSLLGFSAVGSGTAILRRRP